MGKISIELKDAKWLINGKTYSELSNEEQIFFDEFLIAMRINFESEKQKENESSH